MLNLRFDNPHIGSRVMLELNVDAARFSGNKQLQIYTQTNEFID